MIVDGFYLLIVVRMVGFFAVTVLQFTTGLTTSVQQLCVHDIIVVRLQCQPEIIFTDVIRGEVALQAARAFLTVIAAPGISPYVTFRISFFLCSFWPKTEIKC